MPKYVILHFEQSCVTSYLMPNDQCDLCVVWQVCKRNCNAAVQGSGQGQAATTAEACQCSCEAFHIRRCGAFSALPPDHLQGPAEPAAWHGQW